MNLKQLREFVSEGESEQLEFKKSTGDLRGGMETLCALLNGSGGQVLFGVLSGGRITGQTISDATLREVAAEIARIDPPATVSQSRVKVSPTNEVLALETTVRSAAPYTYNGRAFRRIGSTTSIMPQSQYEQRLLERRHSHERWENQIAGRYRLKDLDRREITRTVREAVHANRLEATVASREEVLQKLHLATDQGVLQAGVVVVCQGRYA